MDSRFPRPARGHRPAGNNQDSLSRLQSPSKDQGSAGVKIQAIRSALPTTHPSHRLNGVWFTFASGSPFLGRVRSMVDYSLQNRSTKGRREKSPSTYRAPKNAKRKCERREYSYIRNLLMDSRFYHPGPRAQPRVKPLRQLEFSNSSASLAAKVKAFSPVKSRVHSASSARHQPSRLTGEG